MRREAKVVAGRALPLDEKIIAARRVAEVLIFICNILMRHCREPCLLSCTLNDHCQLSRVDIGAA